MGDSSDGQLWLEDSPTALPSFLKTATFSTTRAPDIPFFSLPSQGSALHTVSSPTLLQLLPQFPSQMFTLKKICTSNSV